VSVVRRRAYPRSMARRPREFAAGVYHTAAHASSDRELFLDDSDRRAFLDLLSITWAKLGLELVSYVLMTNHYHALTWIPDARLSTALKILHGGYSFHHNKRHLDSAHLFRAHCFARRLRDDDDLLATDHYLAHNPVNAGLVPYPLDWPWGSARTHGGLEEPTVLLSDQRLRGAFGGRRDWRRRYAAFIGSQRQEGPPERTFRVAGAGFEPATSGL
jgi:REP-associated tyrosine transposase